MRNTLQKILLSFSWLSGLVGRATPDTSNHGCSRNLGLMSGDIQDWQISASSTASPTGNAGCHPRYGRLYLPSGRAWCPGKKEAYEWLQVDFGVPTKVTGIMTQGREDGQQWVKSYLVSYSSDAFHWKYCTDIYGKRKLFHGNTDSHEVEYSYLDEQIEARFLRVHVMEWHAYPSMRLEVIGCQECNEIISLPPMATFSASTWRKRRKQSTCSPDSAVIYSHGGWCAKHNNRHQWLQIDLGPPTLITGIVTKGQAGSKHKHWVTQYTISYSNDTSVWFFYREDKSRRGNTEEFGGNMDKDTERRHYFNQPFTARYVRIHPMKWKGRVSMRAAIIGCPHKGNCGPGFFRVHENSECVENMAFKKETWVNDKRHSWPSWKYGHSTFAVDGDVEPQIQKCAVLDNYYVDQPMWMVDLGEEMKVRGVVIVAWGKSQGQDDGSLYQDYLYNLDKLTVFVENTGKLEKIITGNKCASISRHNNALSRKRFHFECAPNLKGRYVYIKATGVPNRWARLYSAVLCEVMVY